MLGDNVKRYNLILVIHPDQDKVLMCYRSKDPYKGLYNLLGGKIEQNEDVEESAYRELFEESGISKQQITLYPLIDYVWHPADMSMNVFVGVLTKEVTLVKEVHDLVWMDMTENFFDMSKFAGEGNIGHMMEIYQMYQHKFQKMGD